MKITLDWLRSKGACAEGMQAVAERFPDGAEVAELAEWLQSTNLSWLAWLRDHLSVAEVVGWWASPARIAAIVAGRIAAAKKTKTATGESGAARATGWGGAASATGWRGAVECGPSGAAVVTGTDGCARAGEGGCIALAFERDGKITMRCAEVSARRKGCLKPDTWYRLDSRGRFVVVKEGE